MALHTELKIYTVAYELLKLITSLVKDMPRDFKISIGNKLRDESAEIVTLIIRANVARVKTPHLDELIERIQVMNLFLRLSRDMKWISTGGYGSAIALTTEAGKQAGGWRKHSMASVS